MHAAGIQQKLLHRAGQAPGQAGHGHRLAAGQSIARIIIQPQAEIEKIQLTGIQLPQLLADLGGGAQADGHPGEQGMQGTGNIQQILLNAFGGAGGPTRRQGPVRRPVEHPTGDAVGVGQGGELVAEIHPGHILQVTPFLHQGQGVAPHRDEVFRPSHKGTARAAVIHKTAAEPDLQAALVGRLQQFLEAVADFHFHRLTPGRLQFAAVQMDTVLGAGNQVRARIQAQGIETPLLGFIEHFFQRRKGPVTAVTVQQPGQIPAGHCDRFALLCHSGPAPVSD